MTVTNQISDLIAPVAPKLITNDAFNFLIDPQITMQTSLGSVVLALYPEQAPITVANMLAYADTGFYDGTLFHRVIPNFMVQGGGFNPGLAYKTPTYSPILLESDNGLSNLRGTIAMARTSVPDSATSQFFINHVDNTFLNYTTTSPGYAVFGQVISGLSVIDSMAQVATATYYPYANVPTTNVSIVSIKQTTAGSSITHDGTLLVSDVEMGAQWSYSLDGGLNWSIGTGNSLEVPEGNYAANAIQIRQTDAAGNLSLTTGKLTSNVVVDTTAPVVMTLSPKDEATGVALSSPIIVTFSEAITRGVGVIELKNSAGILIESFDAAHSSRLGLTGSILTIDPSVDLAFGADYQLEFSAGTCEDWAGNPFEGLANYHFSTNKLPSGNISITGTLGQSLTLNASRLKDADGLGSFSYQWMENGNNIGGANASKLMLGLAQEGKTFSVSVSYTDGHGSVETVNSAPLNLGTTGKDTLTSLTEKDSLIGGKGDDRYLVKTTDNVITELAHQGLDTVQSPVSWTLGVNLENLVLAGSANIKGTGNALNNQLSGNKGNNVLSGLGGNDTLTGGAGKDTFIFSHPNHGMDTITDFNRAQGDKLVFTSAEFGSLQSGVLAAQHYIANTSGLAKTNEQHFIFETDTKILRYDSDGSGAASAVQIAKLNINTLSASDILLM